MVYRPTTAPVFRPSREIDRLFEGTFGRGDGTNVWTPTVDVRETDTDVLIHVGIPGVRAEEVEITVENGVLTIRGEKQMERKVDDKQERFDVVEHGDGTFVRSFVLPPGLDESKIEADYDNGMLVIHIPRAALPQPRRIQIGNRGTQQQTKASGQGTPRTSSGGTQNAPPASRAASSPQGAGSEGNR